MLVEVVCLEQVIEEGSHAALSFYLCSIIYLIKRETMFVKQRKEKEKKKVGSGTAIIQLFNYFKKLGSNPKGTIHGKEMKRTSNKALSHREPVSGEDYYKNLSIIFDGCFGTSATQKSYREYKTRVRNKK